ncbi:MFS general substrate transporter [Peniophora sp. CONT]|nr:MFS general substrate transporter [Peniophora sp. CONT]
MSAGVAMAAEHYSYELESFPREVAGLTNPTTTALPSVSSTVALESEHQREEEAIALPPVDGGIQAWTFVFCAFIIETLVWGFPFSYGVFQEWYLSSPDSPFRGASESAINAIGTIAIGLQYIVGAFIMFFVQKYPQWTKPMMIASLIACVGGLALSSFATQVWHLILLQGVVYGTAGGSLYMPVVGWLNEWFVTRRSFACSFIFGGGGLGGAGFPLLANALLQRVGFRWTLRTMAALVGVLGGLALIGAKPRLPVARHSTPAPLSFSFMTSPVFILVAITVFVQGLSYWPVSLYIPSYAASLGFSSLNGTLALAAFNLATVAGQVLFGFYCDKGSYTTVMIGSSVLSAVFAFVLWGFAHSLTPFYLFAVLFGGISGGFSSIFPPASTEIFSAQATTPFMIFGCAKGLASITGPFIAAALHPKSASDELSAGSGGWSGYGFTAITIFVGSGMVASATLSGAVLAFRKKSMKSE